jgi:hypothetical protein
VLQDGLVPVLAGALAGVGVAFAFVRVVGSLLFQVSPYNSGIATGAVGVLMALGAAACLLPARRHGRPEISSALHPAASCLQRSSAPGPDLEPPTSSAEQRDTRQYDGDLDGRAAGRRENPR